MAEKLKIYIAAPIVGIPDDWKDQISSVCFYCKYAGEVYNPAEHGVPNAWGMTMEEWSKCIFALDVVAIDNCDWVVVCDFGRSTAGTAWEAGYAFGKGKKILIIQMKPYVEYSVMMNGCSSNSTTYLDFCVNSKDVSEFFVERGRLASEVTYN